MTLYKKKLGGGGEDGGGGGVETDRQTIRSLVLKPSQPYPWLWYLGEQTKQQ